MAKGEDDDYSPKDNRPPEQLTTSNGAVFMHLLKAAIGSGILFMPYAFKKTGYLAALVCSIFIGTICTHTAVITIRCSQKLCKRARVPSLNFAETAEASLKLGPERVRKYAGAFAITTNVIVCFVQYQTAVVYTLYVATSFKQIIEYFAETHLDVRIYIVSILPFLLLMSLVPNFAYLYPFSIVGSLFLSIGFLITCYYFFEDFSSPEHLEMFTDTQHIPIYCSVFLYAIYNMSMLMPLENTMKTPEKMSIILTITMVINIIINVTFGFFGYNKYIDSCDSVIKNLPLDEFAAQLVKLLVTTSVLLTYGLQYYIPVTILWPMLAKRIGNRRLYESCFRLGGVCLCTLLAVAVPHMAPLLGLFSALSMTTMMLLIPVMIELSTKWNDPRDWRRNFMLIKNAQILVMWALILVYGAMANLREIIAYYQGNTKPEAKICGDD